MIGNLRKLILTLTVVLIATLGLCGSSFGWLNKTALTVDGKVKQATVIRQYFHTGDGSEEDPFVITRPIHFYHLVELYQRKNTVVAGKYFQLGYDLDPNKEGLEVYEYDDLGNVVMEGNTPKTCTTLNMAYYSNEYALIPVGTSVMPFDGHFEGSGLEIENINIRAAETISTSEHFASSDIGIFGYVNGDADISNTYFSNVHIDLTGCDASQTLPGHNANHHKNGVVYVGYLAGHVKESISIQNVFLNNCTIVGAESVETGTTVVKNLYGYIGCVENNDTTLVETLGDSIATQFSGGGTDPGWGNTVNMKVMYNRLYAIARAHRNDGDVDYPSQETLVVKVADDIDPANPPANFAYTKVISRDVVEMDDTVASHYGKRLEYVHHGNDIAGSYYFNIYNGYSPWIYLTGRNQYQTKTVNVYIAEDEDDTVAYFICDTKAKNYLSASASKTLTNTTKTDATRWMIDGDNHLFTYFGVNAYYLNASGLSLYLDDTKASATRWTIEEKAESAEIYTIQDGEKYYINFDDVWQLSTRAPNYAISDGYGHYIGLNETELITVDTIGASASWEMENSSQGIKFTTYVSGIPMYLAYVSGKGLTLSPTTFSWTQEGSTEPYSYTTVSDGETWHLAFDDEWRAVVISGNNIICEVSGNRHYLSADSSLEGVTSGDMDSYRSLWDMDTSASSTTIMLPYDGVYYSLDADVSTGDVYLRVPTASMAATEWHKDPSGNYYVQKNSAPFYLTYDGKWCVKTSSSSFIRSGSNYLAFDSTKPYNVGNVLSQSAGNNRWVFENPGGSGLVYINIEGTTYYLNIRTVSGQKVLSLDYEHTPIIDDDEQVVDPGWSVAEAVRWTGDGRGYYVAYDGEEYYLRYDSGWVVSPVDYTYKASISSNNYLAHQKGAGGYSVYSYTGSDTSSADIKWKSNGEYIWFVDNGTKHYLAFGSAGGVAVISDTPCRWWTTYDTGSGVKNILNTVYNSVHYRLDCEGGNWVTTSLDVETVLFVDNTSSTKQYLCVNQYSAGSLVTRTTDASNTKAHWVYDDAGNIYQDYGGSRYYLKFISSGDNYKFLTVDTSGGSKWYDDTDFPGGVYTLFQDGKFVIYNDDSDMRGINAKWKDIYSGSHYLVYNNGSVADGDSANENREWFFEVSSDTKIFSIHGGKKYYLRWSSSALSLTQTASDSGTSWKVDSTGIHNNSDNSTLTYTTKWTCASPQTKWVVTDGTNYLVNNSGSIGTTTSPESATAWTFSNTSTLGTDSWSGTINNGSYYLYSSSGTLTLSTSSSKRTTWDIANGALHAKDTFYWLKYNGGFLLKSGKDAGVYYGCKGGDGTWNYLTSSMTNTKEASQAAVFKGTSQSKATVSPYHYCVYGDLTYTGMDNNNYLQVYYTDAMGYALKIGSKPSFSWALGSNSKGLKMQYTRKSTTYTLYIKLNSSNEWKVATGDSDRSDVRFFISNAAVPAKVTITVTGANYKDAYRAGSYDATNSRVLKEGYWFGTETNVSYVPTSGFAESVPSVLELNSIYTASRTISPVPTATVSGKELSIDSRVLRTTAQRLYGPYTRTNQYSGYDTYIPLRLQLRDEEDETSYYSDYRIDSRNTGYIVSGSYQNSGYYKSDIRVSDYDTSYVYKALNVSSSSSPNYSSTYDSRLSVITKTAYSNGDNKDGTGGTGKVYGDNGYVRILDEHNKLNIDNYHSSLPDDKISYKTMGLEKYESYTDSEGEKVKQSRDALADMLMGGNDIYGLHFMESTISKDHIIYADHATILGNTYQNYELPEDSIDFKVKERGAINFFAGTYYSDDVEAFFSLHHILRDGNQHITAIKEIKKIYQKGTKSYVYLYGDGTYSDGSSGPESGAKMVFDTSWITNPTIQQNALYYFEIPVNRGEYALGSVPNKVGAYLMYLDIATRGGDVTENRISSEGSGVSNMFKIDYRDAGGTLDGTSLIQFEINAPAENPSSSGKEYSVNMEYETVTGSTIEGLYTLTITNRTGEDLELTVFVCDNDDIRGNDYPYAYTVIYTNSTGTSTLIEQAQTCDTYIVPY